MVRRSANFCLRRRRPTARRRRTKGRALRDGSMRRAVADSICC